MLDTTCFRAHVASMKCILFLSILAMACGAPPVVTAPSPITPAVAPVVLKTADMITVSARNWHATITPSIISWCVATPTGGGELKCGMVPTPGRFGCQYFSEEGADDIATCVLTVTNEACGGCLE